MVFSVVKHKFTCKNFNHQEIFVHAYWQTITITFALGSIVGYPSVKYPSSICYTIGKNFFEVHSIMVKLRTVKPNQLPEINAKGYD